METNPPQTTKVLQIMIFGPSDTEPFASVAVTHVVFMNTATWCAPDKCNELEVKLISFPNLLKAYVDLPKGDVKDIREVFSKNSHIGENHLFPSQ